MVPTASEVIRRKVTLTATLRMVLLFVAIPAMIVPLAVIAAASAQRYGPDRDDWFGMAIYQAIVGGTLVLLWFLAGWISKKMSPVPVVGKCPGCGYSLEGLPTDRCPECNRTIPAEFFDGRAGPTRSLTHDGFVRRVQIILGALVRLGGILVFVPSVIGVLIVGIVMLNGPPEETWVWNSGGSSMQPTPPNEIRAFWMFTVSYAAMFLVLSIVGFLPLFFTRRATRWLMGGRATLASAGNEGPVEYPDASELDVPPPPA